MTTTISAKRTGAVIWAIPGVVGMNINAEVMGNEDSTFPNTAIRVPLNVGALTDFRVNAVQNALDAPATIRVLLDGAFTGMVLQFAVSESGEKTIQGPIPVSAGQRISFLVDTLGTTAGSITPAISVRFN